MDRRLIVLVCVWIACIMGQTIPNDDVEEAQNCQAALPDPITTLKSGNFASSSFFECFRSSAQIYAFIDSMAAASPKKTITKFEVSKTYLNRTINGYKLSSSFSKGQAIYIQGLQHAREWISVMTVVYYLAKLLDSIAAKETIEYDYYIVPIVNLDGFIQTWTTGERYRRKNMRPVPKNYPSITNQLEAGVDLNRNWGPATYFNLDNVTATNLTYPGSAPFSEPEVAGIHTWLQAHEEVIGYLDIHSYAAMILTPYGDSNNTLPQPYDEKFIALGTFIRDTVIKATNVTYNTMSEWSLYACYGTFEDYVFRTYQKAVITIEINGTDFIVPASTISSHNKEVYSMIQAFASNMPSFYSNLPTPMTKLTNAANTHLHSMFVLFILFPLLLT
ncbi:carboxypeptidase [Thraustotheca clavata]|uniref:Carboxypeptidase n=1 Tax=Thraustotheca clavata TaxID=74557 RepID=A0A1V9ZQ71_9STRA|nr:carboxypeptidase [Thraustotheca clavata]